MAPADPTGLSVSSWDWAYDTALLDNEMTDTDDSDDLRTWRGRMVFGGPVGAETTRLGLPCTKSLEIDQETVINRYVKSGGPPPEPGATDS